MKHQPDETEAKAMTVNERLAASGLIDDFDQAAASGDEKKLRHILVVSISTIKPFRRSSNECSGKRRLNASPLIVASVAGRYRFRF